LRTNEFFHGRNIGAGGGGVYFHHIQGAAIVNLAADAAFIAGFALLLEILIRQPFFAVHNFRDKPGGRGFARASRAGEKISVGYPVLDGGVFKNFDRNFLTQEIVPVGRPVFSVDCQSHIEVLWHIFNPRQS
jgi:hypothetical protein